MDALFDQTPHRHEALIIAAAAASLSPSAGDPLGALRRLAHSARGVSVVEVPPGRGDSLALAVKWAVPADLAPLLAALNASAVAKLDVDLLTDLAPDRGTHAPALGFLLAGLRCPLRRLTLHDGVAPAPAALASLLAGTPTLESLTLSHYPATLDRVGPLLVALRAAPHALASMRLGHRRLPPPRVSGGCFLPPAVRPDPAERPLAELAALLEARGRAHERVRAAVRAALVPARVVLRSRGGALGSLPPEVRAHIVRFATRDPGALAAAQLARLCTLAAGPVGRVGDEAFGAAMDAAVGAFRSEGALAVPERRAIPGVCPFVPVVKCAAGPAVLVEWGR
ncbi:hypothetical protein Q8F55_000104 [Vanrija albida]|uniref:F-box domain-containing protein n=1 Tax=Vanrija albida TaxID=181172 RepID=A0ABR3QCA6_9TREE